MVLSAAEQRLLEQLQAKAAEPPVAASSSAGGTMADSSKRLRDSMASDLVEDPFDGGDDGFDFVSHEEQLPILKSPGLGGKKIPIGHEGGLVAANIGARDLKVPLPEGLTWAKWDRTICELPKVAKNPLWSQKSYNELVLLSQTDTQLRQYLNWLQSRFGASYTGGKMESQGLDFAGYLMHIRYQETFGGYGFKRNLR